MDPKYTVAPLTVGVIWDAKREKIGDDEFPFYLLSKLTLKDGVPLSTDEFRALEFPIVNELMGQLNMGNGMMPTE
jgi:hypothetical protein